SLKQALACRQVTPDIRKGLEYDLGAAWEKAGKPGKALYHYRKVSALDRTYRDVGEVVARLTETFKPENDPGVPRGELRNGARSERASPDRTTEKGESESPRTAGARPGRARSAAK